MNSASLLALGLVWVSPSLAPSASSVIEPGLAFAPSEGLRLRVELSQASDLTLSESWRRMDLGSRRGERTEGGVAVELKESLRVAFEDGYEAVDAGRAVDLLRSFERLEKGSVTTTTATAPTVRARGDDLVTEAASGLLRKRVRLAWDAADEIYRAAYDGDDEGEEELLEGLRHDANLVFLLPDDEVQEGSRWTLSPDHLGRLLAPAGDLGFSWGDLAPLEVGREDEVTWEGEFEATLATVEGHQAVVELTADVARVTRSLVSHGAFGGFTDGEIEIQRRDQHRLEGTLRWDVARGLPIALTLEGDLERNSHQWQRSNGEDENALIEFEEDYLGETRIELRFTVLED